MRLQLYNAIVQLQPYIRLICTMECDDDIDIRHVRVLPDTCTELFINYTTTPLAIIDNELYKCSIITSRMSQPMDVQMRKGAGVIAICFQPGMAYKFFHLSMHTLTDTTAELADVWKGMAIEMEEKLADAGDNVTRVAIVQQYLLRQLANSKDDRQITNCLLLAQRSSEPLSVQQLTKNAGISQRYLLRKFQQYVGLSPKEYLKVNRFVRSLQHLKKYPHQSLTHIAYESGYYDQAHFIRDYNVYSGHTPREVAQSQHILY
ncbi:transcriptional regulator, AraC family [Chitinophaga sp. YR627]|uniref:AraC family transcriptional regulator n=1 Tax=Chitinophaga sp. YR627 TaxID=1881041 RepID=UPI0008DF8B3E|nr:AraC family transcriptional regulator [Chitinophaga sp. YR627]SFP00997.1 transcriptional regulator, AraC family [Chitinophaga sp. YR627]